MNCDKRIANTKQKGLDVGDRPNRCSVEGVKMELE